MGKLNSKQANNRRGNPEGDSFVANSYINGKGFEGCERFMGLESKLKDRNEGHVMAEDMETREKKKKRKNSLINKVICHQIYKREANRLEHGGELKVAEKRLSAHVRSNIREQPPCNETGDHYCVDENAERRNHYLDLAGIENYTSRFDPGGIME
ncbi:protein naked cuticle homolog 2 isoform X5 [Engystomops pustulosus]|uniref:protein naked cuticle homolog 2 isoform X5 n=1 Tax=Engystomops pustulosus TaxID=76066 RepID=UPI003AFA817F